MKRSHWVRVYNITWLITLELVSGCVRHLLKIVFHLEENILSLRIGKYLRILLFCKDNIQFEDNNLHPRSILSISNHVLASLVQVFFLDFVADTFKSVFKFHCFHSQCCLL